MALYFPVIYIFGGVIYFYSIHQDPFMCFRGLLNPIIKVLDIFRTCNYIFLIYFAIFIKFFYDDQLYIFYKSDKNIFIARNIYFSIIPTWGNV